MESCFGTLKTELVHQPCYPNRNAALARLARLHRRILQSSAAPFRSRVYHPRTGRAPSRLIVSTKSGEGQGQDAAAIRGMPAKEGVCLDHNQADIHQIAAGSFANLPRFRVLANPAPLARAVDGDGTSRRHAER